MGRARETGHDQISESSGVLMNGAPSVGDPARGRAETGLHFSAKCPYRSDPAPTRQAPGRGRALDGDRPMNRSPGEDAIKAAADPAILESLVLANRILHGLGVLDGYGHVSARDPRHPDYFFLASALAPALVTAADIMVYDLDAQPVEARDRSMYAERFIHGEIYRARPDVHAVVHSHSPTVIPFGVSRTALRPIYHMASFIPQAVPEFEIRASALRPDLRMRTKE